MGFLFTLVAAPVIHLSGLDNVDSCPTPEDIEKANRLAEELRQKYLANLDADASD